MAKGLDEPHEGFMVAAGYIEPNEYVRIKNEREDIEFSLSEHEQEKPIYLDYLGSNRTFIYQDKVFTKEEKAKLESFIKMFLMDRKEIRRMAEIIQRGKTWSYKVYLGTDPLTNKRMFDRKGGFKTQLEAKAAARLVEIQKENGTYVKESEIPFEKFAQDWLKTYSRSGIKVSSERAREKEMKHFINIWGHYPISRITKKMYQDRIIDLSEQYSHNYMDGIHACGRMLFRHAVELGLIKVNPTENFKLPKKQLTVEELEIEEEEVIFLEKAELAHFLNLAHSDGLEMDYLIFTLLSYTGLRIGELLALKWGDFNEKQTTIRVTKTIYNPTNHFKKYQLLTPKTKGSIRTIKIDEMIS